jgi:hypothetical protein
LPLPDSLLGIAGFLNFDAVLFGQVAQGFRERQLLVLHQKMHRVAALPASETLIDIFGRRNGEGGRLLGMKWTQTDQVGPTALEVDKLLDDFFDFGGLQYFLNTLFGYHGVEFF